MNFANSLLVTSSRSTRNAGVAGPSVASFRAAGTRVMPSDPGARASSVRWSFDSFPCATDTRNSTGEIPAIPQTDDIFASQQRSIRQWCAADIHRLPRRASESRGVTRLRLTVTPDGSVSTVNVPPARCTTPASVDVPRSSRAACIDSNASSSLPSSTKPSMRATSAASAPPDVPPPHIMAAATSTTTAAPATHRYRREPRAFAGIEVAPTGGSPAIWPVSRSRLTRARSARRSAAV